jgi:DNA-binding LacI/PurR family transcriptional regulator
MHTSARRGDVALLAGVAESTVSRALNDSALISEAIKAKVRKAAEKLGYVPSRQAALFASKKTCRLGFVVRSYKAFPPFSRAYFPALLDGTVLGADERGYLVTIVLDRVNNEFRDLVQVVRSREVDGLILSIVPTDDPRIEQLQGARVPFVVINDQRKGCYSVNHSPVVGMQKAFDYAVSLGHTHFGYVTGDMGYRNARDRFDRFQDLALKFGVYTKVEEGNFSRTSGYRCTGRLLSSENAPTVIMTASDRSALGVLDYCREHKIRVPDDLSVIGYDNLYPAEDVLPTLTTITNPVSQEGSTAAHLLIDILEKKVARPVCRWLETDFIIRQSTGPCRKQ